MNLQVKYGGAGILFTGDSMPLTEANLISRYALNGTQVITAPHHGASGSTSNDFLDYIQTKSFNKVLIPNQNLSDPAVVPFKSRLDTRNLPYWSTGHNGTMYLQSDGTTTWTASEAAEGP
jgi:beta-lactamase superfamily II metal-dependent hydrolase